MVRRDRHLLLLLAAVAVGLALAQSLGAMSADVLLAVPPLLMLAPLVVGRYLGEHTIARLRRGAPPRPRRVRAASAGVCPSTIVLPRGGRLVAAALARRGPPALLLAR